MARANGGWVFSSNSLVTGQLQGENSHLSLDLGSGFTIHQSCLTAVEHTHAHHAVKTFMQPARIAYEGF